MKKLFLALCGLLIAQFSFGENSTWKLILDMCGGTARGNVKSWTVDKKTKVNFDDKCRMTSADVQDLGTFSFSYNGDAVSCSLKVPSGETMMDYYEGKDSTRVAMYGGNGEVATCQKAKNDSHGNIVSNKVLDGNGKVETTQTYKYTYNAKGQETACEMSENGVLKQKIYFTYDAKGNLASVKETDAKGKVKELSKYNSYGDLVQYIKYKDGVEYKSQSITYVYDSKGNWTKQTISVKSSKGWENATNTTTKEIVYY